MAELWPLLFDAIQAGSSAYVALDQLLDEPISVEIKVRYGGQTRRYEVI